MQRSPAYPFLLAAVILLGVLIVIALGVMVVGLSMRLGGHGARPDTAPPEVALPAGARVVSADVSGDRLVLRLKGSFGDEIDIVDIETGRVVARVRAGSPPKTQ